MVEAFALGASAVRISTPYVAGSLGGTLSERSGVVNIALEGMMLVGAFAYVWAAWAFEQRFGPGAGRAWAPWVGLLAGMAAGVALATLHAVATVALKAENIICGLALNILAVGATGFGLKAVWGSASNSAPCPQFTNWEVFGPGSSLAPLNGLFHPVLALVVALVVGAHWMLGRTVLGLRLRAVGEHPAAADSVGISVGYYRTLGVLLGGAAASLGGVWMAAEQGRFSAEMTGGRGYIALAAMIVGKWRPLAGAVACGVFGLAEAVQVRLQVARPSGGPATDWVGAVAGAVPVQALQALPYVVTLIVLAGFVGRATPPAALGVPFEKAKGR